MIPVPTTLCQARDMLILASINWDKAKLEESQCKYGAARRSRHFSFRLARKIEMFLWGYSRKSKVLKLRNRLVKSYQFQNGLHLL